MGRPRPTRGGPGGSRARPLGPPHTATTRQGLTPPRDGAALLGDSGRPRGLAVLEQIAYALTRDPFVAGERGAGLVERREQPRPRLANPRGFGGCGVVIVALIPVADPPDALAADPAPAPWALREAPAPGGFECRLRPAGGVGNRARVRGRELGPAREHQGGE